MKTRWFCLLDQSLDGPNIPKNILSKIFLVFQTHPSLSTVITGWNFSIKMSTRSFLFGKTISIEILSIVFLPLDHWRADIPDNTLYNVSSRYWNSYFFVTRGFGSSMLFSAESSKVVNIGWWNKLFAFSSHQNLDSPKIPKASRTIDILGIQSYLSPHLQRSFFQDRSQSKSFLFWGSSVVMIFFHSLRFTSHSTKMSRTFFENGVFSVF